MVQKHKMIANFEQLNYNGELLKNSWLDKLRFFEQIASQGMVNSGMTDFMNWMLNTDHCERFFAGSSLWTLLISKPRNGKLNYQQTLSIAFDNRTGLYAMQYSDWDTIDNQEDYKNAIKWNSKCMGVELPTKFLEFLDWNKNWNQ